MKLESAAQLFNSSLLTRAKTIHKNSQKFAHFRKQIGEDRHLPTALNPLSSIFLFANIKLQLFEFRLEIYACVSSLPAHTWALKHASEREREIILGFSRLFRFGCELNYNCIFHYFSIKN